jgi:hypothetical protein
VAVARAVTTAGAATTSTTVARPTMAIRTGVSLPPPQPATVTARTEATAPAPDEVSGGAHLNSDRRRRGTRQRRWNGCGVVGTRAAIGGILSPSSSRHPAPLGDRRLHTYPWWLESAVPFEHRDRLGSCRHGQRHSAIPEGWHRAPPTTRYVVHPGSRGCSVSGRHGRHGLAVCGAVGGWVNGVQRSSARPG